MVSFQAGWFKFSLCTVHIFFGDNSAQSDGYKRRVAEINNIATEMASRADREDENYILLGDFNIKNTMDESMRALTDAGFILPPELFPSNLTGSKYYDQIAFRTRRDCVSFLSAGVFDFSKAVYLPDQYEHYAPVLPSRHRELKEDGKPVNVGKDKDYYSKRWLTWQMSDHLPLWVELAIDFSDEHLMHNLSDAMAVRGECAQHEVDMEDEEDDDKAERPTMARHAPPVQASQTRRRPKRRKEPLSPRREKTGTARPDSKLTLRECWHIFWYVASGKADAAKRRRKDAEQPQDRPKRARRKKR